MAFRRLNPFYPLSILVGIAFLFTAVAYGVMAFRGAAPQLVDNADESSLMSFLDEHGVTIFLVELGTLMVTTVAAISTDSFWMGKPAKPTTTNRDESNQNKVGESQDESAE
jgi:hypothetical protein